MFDDPGRDSISTQSITSTSSMGSESLCSSSFSRLSFDFLPSTSPETFALKPHRSSDFAYSGMFHRKTNLTFRDFYLLYRIGASDIGTVYLCYLQNSTATNPDCELDNSCFYAMKVIDKEALALKKKVPRAEMERKILKMLDYPFLPTLFAEFEASHFSCIVMEFCPGGDLHSLRHKQLHRHFPLTSARLCC